MSAPGLAAADTIAPALLHRTFREAFADYLIGPFLVPLAQWPAFLARQGVDLARSRVALHEGQPIAFALVAPRPAQTRWRLATMGALPAARGSGAAARLLDELLTRAAAQGQCGLELEVFAQNERALRLYRSRGFEPRHALHGFDAPATGVEAAAPPAVDAVEVVDLAAGLDWLAQAERTIDDLPLQVCAPVVAALADPPQVWRHGPAQLVFGVPDEGAITVHSLIDPTPTQAGAQALLRALRALHPGRALRVPALQRDDLGGQALRRAGFTPQPLHQWLMHKPLPVADPDVATPPGP